MYNLHKLSSHVLHIIIFSTIQPALIKHLLQVIGEPSYVYTTSEYDSILPTIKDFSEHASIEPLNAYNVVKLSMRRKLRQQS